MLSLFLLPIVNCRAEASVTMNIVDSEVREVLTSLASIGGVNIVADDSVNGKIKLKLNQKSSIRNNIYEVFIDGNFIGIIDYKNPKLDFITNLGNHKILVKGKDFEKEHNFILSSQKIIVPIEINENFFWTKTSAELPKLMNGFLIGLLLVYALVITFLLQSVSASSSDILPALTISATNEWSFVI